MEQSLTHEQFVVLMVAFMYLSLVIDFDKIIESIDSVQQVEQEEEYIRVEYINIEEVD